MSSEESACRRCELSKVNDVIIGRGRGPLYFLFNPVTRLDSQEGDNINGRARKLFEQILERAGLTRETVYTANLTRCARTQKDGWKTKDISPLKHQIQACKFWIKKDLDTVQPKVIFLMGQLPFEILTGQDLPLKTCIHQALSVPYTSAPLIPLYPPATLLNRNNWEVQKTVNTIKKAVDDYITVPF